MGELLISNKKSTQSIAEPDLAGEVWKVVPEWPGYSASNLGRISSTNGNGNHAKSRVLSGCHNLGYIHIMMTRYHNGIRERKIRKAHQLVLEAFVGPCPPRHEVNHKNGIRDDNRLENLEYCTSSENTVDAVRRGTWPLGSRRWNSKYGEAQVELVLELKADGLRPGEIAKRTMLPMSFVCHVYTGRQWKYLKEPRRDAADLSPLGAGDQAGGGGEFG